MHMHGCASGTHLHHAVRAGAPGGHAVEVVCNQHVRADACLLMMRSELSSCMPASIASTVRSASRQRIAQECHGVRYPVTVSELK